MFETGPSRVHSLSLPEGGVLMCTAEPLGNTVLGIPVSWNTENSELLHASR